ncbi:serine carboxypeptidase-like 31 [Phoenix dactylifera]|uniref:Carboxypeptidase n=1 Tax=Phoenix dactylifera TaxID=42345 RepID=A0A8B8ZZY8_PHODC|nr:serine carboxypeptidase-like 31 [Phoenix dactylifera]
MRLFKGLGLFIWAASAFLLVHELHPVSCGRLGNSFVENGDLVTDLPGQPVVKFRHYAGYVTVNKKNGRGLFYWFYEAASHADEKPLVLWLNGGPGCSSVGYGAAQEIGPFLVEKDGSKLKFNPFSWNKEANLLFLESPVGVGFSYSNTTSDYEILGDSFTANDTYTFLHNWFEKFPSYRNRTFYMAGESYAGMLQLWTLLVFNLLLHKSNILWYCTARKVCSGLGNPETSDSHDWQGLVDYAWSHAIVSDATHDITRDNCKFDSDDPWNNTKCRDAVDEVLKQYGEIDIYSLYTPTCIQNSSGSNNGGRRLLMFKSTSKMIPRIMGSYDPCLDGYTTSFYNRPDVQKALHASDGHNIRNWSICNKQIFNEWKDSMPSVLPIYKKLIAGGLRIWVYSGDTDGRVPVLSTRYCLDTLGLPTVGPWRPWYHKKQVAGWLQEYEGLTFATFRGAGHDVPTFKPSSSLAFFTAFLAGKAPSSTR